MASFTMNVIAEYSTSTSFPHFIRAGGALNTVRANYSGSTITKHTDNRFLLANQYHRWSFFDAKTTPTDGYLVIYYGMQCSNSATTGMDIHCHESPAG